MTASALPKRIGLTGSIGAGKSTVSKRLRSLGALVLDADIAARQVVEPGEEGLDRLINRYGAGILLESGGLNRRALAKIIFADEAERRAVNGLLHPLIKKRLQEQGAFYRSLTPKRPIFYDVPLLIEIGMHKEMDETWLVEAQDALRLKRIMLRDGCSEQEARSRILSQMPQEEKRGYAHRIIDNSGSLEELYAKVDELYLGVLGE
ncbi:MAG TPA: dephospho-CoA kinase [Clostridia bacterium]|mgnify:FL=1|nr:dephospho-CoA kinase [Clostridia bacterium]